ncbi:MAG: hypothetical protein JWM04_793 [Verrucomicrobiales bacterium]|nr:hypothetical protein [Verrucomicrobiales bacterium]
MTLWRKLSSACRAIFLKKRVEAEMENELRSHIELRTQESIDAGKSADEAYYSALRHFGSKESIKQDCREQRSGHSIENFSRDVRFGVRQLQRNPGFSCIVILILGLGIGANTSIFSVINTVVLRPLPFKEPERIVTIWENDRSTEKKRVSPANFFDWQKQARVFESIAFSPAWSGSREFNIVDAEGAERLTGAYVSSGFFPVFGVNPLLGRTFTSEDDLPEKSDVAVLSYGLWKRRFGGDQGILGKVITLDNYWRREFRVVGVMPFDFNLPSKEDLWISAGWMMRGTPRREGGQYEVLARLKPGVTVQQAQSEMNFIQSRISNQYPESHTSPQTRVTPLLEEWVGNSRRSLLLLLGAVGLVLLTGCVNVAGLVLAKGVARQKEIALRLAIGASRSRIVNQLLTESLVLSIAGGFLGIFLAYAGVKLFVAFSPGNIPRLDQVTIDTTALGFTIAIATITGIVFGLVPALQCSKPDLNETLKGECRSTSAGGRTGRIRSYLIIAEVAMATVLLVGAGLMLQSFSKLSSLDRGIHPEHLLTAELDFSLSGFTTWTTNTQTRPQVKLRQLLGTVRQLPGVESAGAANSFLRSDNRPANQPFSIFERPAPSATERPNVDNKAITPGYVQTAGMRIQSGRDVLESDVLGAQGVVLVNESFTRRFFPGEDPLGKHISLDGNSRPLDSKDNLGLPIWSEIVGVVTDVKSLTVQPTASPEIYWSYWQWPMQRPLLFVRTRGEPGALMESIRGALKSTIPNLPALQIRSMQERVGESIAQPRFQAGVLNIFGGMALLLAACGVYGMVAFGVAQRRHEISIRMALGAQRTNVVFFVVSHGLMLVLTGLIVGLVSSLGLTTVMRTMLFEIHPHDPATLLTVSLVLSAVAFLACWIPASRAANIDPMVALRSEQ